MDGADIPHHMQNYLSSLTNTASNNTSSSDKDSKVDKSTCASFPQKAFSSAVQTSHLSHSIKPSLSMHITGSHTGSTRLPVTSHSQDSLLACVQDSEAALCKKCEVFTSIQMCQCPRTVEDGSMHLYIDSSLLQEHQGNSTEVLSQELSQRSLSSMSSLSNLQLEGMSAPVLQDLIGQLQEDLIASMQQNANLAKQLQGIYTNKNSDFNDLLFHEHANSDSLFNNHLQVEEQVRSETNQIDLFNKVTFFLY